MGAAGRVLDSANPRDKSLTLDCVRCSEDEKAYSERNKVEIEGTCGSKNLDETVRLQSEKTEKWM